MLSAEIIKQLSSCRSETINWKTQIGNFQFKRSNQSTSYEKMEIKFINQVGIFTGEQWKQNLKDSRTLID